MIHALKRDASTRLLRGCMAAIRAARRLTHVHETPAPGASRPARRPPTTVFLGALLLPLWLALAASPAYAEKADKQKPIEIDADRIHVDDRQKVHIFEGNVLMKQGTLEIRGDRVVVTQDEQGFKTGVATAQGSKLATFKQKRDNSDEWVTGEAERLEYDARTNKVKLIGRARATSGQDEVRGAYIEYDQNTDQYYVTTAGGTSSAPSGRVRAVIQPKNTEEQ
ncbi:MAG: lipopolysaccharide transport periplasmic protein LptA [Tepidiphilus sp.]|nr:lipopolysaccharide transport periplasmic protein LptA [Tepidiphilus sp.]MDD3432434.1 lipopolysaccharide transport periplasmic protein LptA [Tepidiphilus sp.]